MRAYDPSLGRFLSRDPLGRAPLFFDASQPYVYGGNNPLTNVDPSGQMFARQMMDGGDWMPHPAARSITRRVQTTRARRVVGQHKQSGNRLLVASVNRAGLPRMECAGACAAKKKSDEAVAFFGWMGAIVGVIGAAIALIGVALATEVGAAIAADIAAAAETFGLSLAAIPELASAEVIAANLIPFGATIALFGAATGAVAFMFSDASSHADNSGWWTIDHLEALRWQALGLMGSVAWIFKYLADKVAQVAAISPVIEKGAFGLSLGSQISLLASGFVISQINGYINDEEADLRG